MRVFFPRKLSTSSVKALKEKGFEVLSVEVLDFKPLEFDEKKALSSDVLVFSSKRGVEFFFKKVPPKRVKDKTLIAVGSATAGLLSKMGFEPLIPKSFSGEGIVELLRDKKLLDRKIALIKPKKGTETVSDFLRKNNAEFCILRVYETVFKENIAEDLKKVFEKCPDYVVFTSPSTFKALVAVLPSVISCLRKAKIVPIGKTTEKFLLSKGLKPYRLPDEFSINGVLRLLFREAENWKLS